MASDREKDELLIDVSFILMRHIASERFAKLVSTVEPNLKKCFRKLSVGILCQCLDIRLKYGKKR